jgi:hypothetical protein
MKYLLIVLLFLTGCTKPPVRFEATVVKASMSYSDKYNNVVNVFDDKYGTTSVYNTPFIDKIAIRSKVLVGCDVNAMIGIINCSILEIK